MILIHRKIKILRIVMSVKRESQRVYFVNNSAATSISTSPYQVTTLGISDTLYGSAISLSGSFTTTGAISVSNTTNASSSTNGGAVTIAGGIAVAQDAYVGGTLSLGSGLSVTQNATIGGTLAVTGKITTSSTPTASTDVTTKSYVDTAVTSSSGVFNVKSYGVVQDGTTDDATGINAAILAAKNAGGGTVYLPTGKYYIKSNLFMYTGVRLLGANAGMYRGSFVFSAPSGSITNFGTMIVILQGSALYNAITMNQWDATIENIEFHYPDITPSLTSYATISANFGWTISIGPNAHNCTIRNVQCNLAYQFLTCEGDGVTLENIQGFPIFKGISMGRVADVARLINVHFNPNVYAGVSGSNLETLVKANATAIETSGAEEFMYLNVFVYGYNIGFDFLSTYPGITYGSVTNFGADIVNYGVRVQTTSINDIGVKFTSGNFIPSIIGISVTDSSSTSGHIPRIILQGVNFFNAGGYTHAINIGSSSRARLTWANGYARNFTTAMLECTSANAFIRIVNVRHLSGTRITNSGGSQLADLFSESTTDILGINTALPLTTTNGNVSSVSAVSILGALSMNSSTAGGNSIVFNRANNANPAAIGSRSSGARLVLFPNTTATNTDYAIGIGSSTLWLQVDVAANISFWAGATQTLTSSSSLFSILTAASTSGNLTVGGTATINGASLTVTSGTLTVGSTSTFTGAMQVNNAITTTGDVTVGGNLTVTGTNNIFSARLPSGLSITAGANVASTTNTTAYLSTTTVYKRMDISTALTVTAVNTETQLTYTINEATASFTMQNIIVQLTGVSGSGDQLYNMSYSMGTGKQIVIKFTSGATANTHYINLSVIFT